jgi:cell division protein FtsQ
MQPLAKPARRDPAPSRWAYRWQRLWLTPVYRFAFRFVLPFAVIFAMGAAVWADKQRSSAITAQMAGLQDVFENRPEFRVEFLSIEGASADLADAVRAKLAVTLPASSFDLDLDALRDVAQSMDAVAEASVQIRAGGVLRVLLVERQAAVIWRDGDQMQLLDSAGHRVAGLISRSDRADLPLILGTGANLHTQEALDLIVAAGPIAPNMRALQRMGDRRWDIILDRNQRILLPEADALAALDRALALDGAEQLFARDITVIDLRYAARPILRMAPFAMNESLRARGLIDPVESKL